MKKNEAPFIVLPAGNVFKSNAKPNEQVTFSITVLSDPENNNHALSVLPANVRVMCTNTIDYTYHQIISEAMTLPQE